jgi:glycosyltransferase involved in cell wall biosynthesis
VSAIGIVIPTLGRHALLRRVLDRLDRQTAPQGSFEVVVVADAKEERLDEIDRALEGRSFPARRLRGPRPGASAARNEGWRALDSPLVLFVDDDILPEPELVAQHLGWHDRHPQEEIGVLGHVRWADELDVTPFMRWLEHGIQFDYPNIDGEDAGWARFYTANASVKRTVIERVGGFEEERLPFGYEDLDLALRMHEQTGFHLLYNRAAVAEHVHPMDLEFWKRRVARIAISEREFVRMHPDFRPYFYELFSKAASDPRANGRGERLARFVPRSLPVLGERVWSSADAVYRQALAGPFLEAWEAAGG